MCACWSPFGLRPGFDWIVIELRQLEYSEGKADADVAMDEVGEPRYKLALTSGYADFTASTKQRMRMEADTMLEGPYLAPVPSVASGVLGGEYEAEYDVQAPQPPSRSAAGSGFLVANPYLLLTERARVASTASQMDVDGARAVERALGGRGMSVGTSNTIRRLRESSSTDNVYDDAVPDPHHDAQDRHPDEVIA